MSFLPRPRAGSKYLPLLVVAAAALAAAPANALADPGGAQASHGGTSAPGQPVVTSVRCKTQCLSVRTVVPGSVVKLKGEFLDFTQHVVFRGAAGPLPADLTYRDALRVRAVVPEGAIASRPYVTDEGGVKSNRAPQKLKVSAASALPSYLFPVKGAHSYGDGFGAPRGGRTHQGQDLPAACGRPLVASAAATVTYSGYQASTGNYLVLSVAGSDLDLVYMHMLETPLVKSKQTVAAGQLVGKVGNTGHSFGCHLHFEIWQGGWYSGGSPIDPLPYLKQWDASS